MPVSQVRISQHQAELRACARCPDMLGPVITGQPVDSPIMLIGQAPGAREGELGRPFAWTAGRTLFQWFAGLGVDERTFRERVYIAAVCRCFPGKAPRGGDRVPAAEEINNCRTWLDAELDLLQPRLLIPVGKLAINQFIPCAKLTEVIGELHSIELQGRAMDLVPLPHPSGASTWHRTEPGKGLLNRALGILRAHPAWTTLAA